ncbi:MAG: SH3 domain-containing protein [Treponema sp.]|jgi:hypothetical protein|nr:SH3 domain-containing protein [Treponema sp.]
MNHKSFIIIVVLLLHGSILYAQTALKQYTAIVNDNFIRIRDQPGLDGKRIGGLNQGAIVSVFGRSQERMFLNGLDSFWLKIYADNIEGWVFGAYINLLDSQYDLLPVLSDKKQIVQLDLNYYRNLPMKELILKEKETIKLQANHFISSTLHEYYEKFSSIFNQKQNLRPFFLNSVEAARTETDMFFILSASVLCDYIQSSYIDNIHISHLDIYNDVSAIFYIGGFKKPSTFTDMQIRTIAFNIKKIEKGNFVLLEGKTIIDDIIISPYTLDDFGGDVELFKKFITPPYFTNQSELLKMILE